MSASGELHYTEQPTVAEEDDFAQVLRRTVMMEFQQNENLSGLEVTDS